MIFILDRAVDWNGQRVSNEGGNWKLYLYLDVLRDTAIAGRAKGPF